VAVAPVRQSVKEDIVGWIAACILIALLLPMGALLYVDILEAKNEVNQQLEKVEKLRRQIEQKQREKDK
jgi:sensor c-di-GMP phosphodiesterase-like protein